MSVELRRSDPDDRRPTAAPADPPREFVDANVLVYAFDSSAGDKKDVAEDLLARLWTSGAGCLSVQVLQEFFVTITTKVPQLLPVDDATERVRELATWKVFSPKADDVLGAISIQKESKLKFWDAMVVRAAVELGCGVLWTEDLNDGQIIKTVRIQNPFSKTAPTPSKKRRTGREPNR
jgi:predicted nucleic acid-binding protein